MQSCRAVEELLRFKCQIQGNALSVSCKFAKPIMQNGPKSTELEMFDRALLVQKWHHDFIKFVKPLLNVNFKGKRSIKSISKKGKSQGISRYLKESQAISRYLKVSQGISRYLKVSQGISRYLKVSQGISRYLKVSRGIPRHLKVSQGISRYLKVSQGILRYLKVY